MTRYVAPPDPHDDYAVEPIPGLPAALPEGERILWRGSPQWGGLAIRAFHARKVGLYFAALLVWRVLEAKGAGLSWTASLTTAAGIVPIAALAIAILTGLAYAYARSTIYTITDKRVVIRSGVAMPITLNLPFKRIDGAGLKLRTDGSGDLVLTPNRTDRVPLLACWPNNRPWRWTRPQPMLRDVPNAARVAEILAGGLSGAPVPVRSEDASPAPAPAGQPIPAAG